MIIIIKTIITKLESRAILILSFVAILTFWKTKKLNMWRSEEKKK